MKPHRFLLLIFFLPILFSCSNSPRPVASGLDGRLFYEPQRKAENQLKLEKERDVAKEKFEQEPSEENYCWYGRREAYLSHFEKAIEIFSEGIERYPLSYKLYRHRAHRYISLRDFDKSIEDGKRAAELIKNVPIETEQDGAPNKLNIPLSSTQFNIYYHLGLAYYLKADYAKAAQAYEMCLAIVDNDDLLVATTDWLYMTYVRLNRKEDATKLLDRINDKLTIIENDAYLKRLLMYKGLQPADLLLAVEEGNIDSDLAFATQGYGVGNWYLSNGDTARAIEVFNHVVKGPYFSAFGFIAAEADLYRLNPK